MSPGWGMRWQDDGRAEMQVPGSADYEVVAIVGFELADLYLLRDALVVTLDRLEAPPAGVGGLDRPITEHDEVARLLRSVEHSIEGPPVQTY